jgi:hypothetical protein
MTDDRAHEAEIDPGRKAVLRKTAEMYLDQAERLAPTRQQAPQVKIQAAESGIVVTRHGIDLTAVESGPSVESQRAIAAARRVFFQAQEEHGRLHVLEARKLYIQVALLPFLARQMMIVAGGRDVPQGVYI